MSNTTVSTATANNEVTTKLRDEYLVEFYKNAARSRFLNKDHRTRQSDELNFYIPEKWNYNMDI